MDSTVSLIAANGGEYGHFPLTYPFDVQQKRCAETFMFHFFWQWTRARGEEHRARVRLDNWVLGEDRVRLDNWVLCLVVILLIVIYFWQTPCLRCLRAMRE
jgi:hypothetical protein